MYFQIFIKFLILVVVLNYSYAKLYNDDLLDYLITNRMVSKVFNIFMIIVALLYLFNRDFFLPFLGPTVIPISESDKSTENLINIPLVGLPPNTKVIYWASEYSENEYENPLSAYKDYSNSGIVKTNEFGNVIIQISCPGRYKISKFGMLKKLLKRHVHYRYELPYKGLYSRVYTKNIDKC